jgi:acetyl-CoA acetyltransferase family protein
MIAPHAIDQVIFGNVMQTSADAAYLARHVGLRAELPEAVPAVTVNRLCGSGFEAVAMGARLLAMGEARTVLVGGTESMSQAPYVLRGGRFGYRLGHGELEDSLTSGLTDSVAGMPMAITAENLAVKYGISREACDAFALESQQRTEAAQLAGHFAAELSPITLSDRGKEITVAKDEHPRPGSNIDGLRKLKPVFKKDGVVTAGNASGMVDGASALIMTTRAHAKTHGWAELGEYLGSFVVGCDPKIMGIGPVGASRGVLAKLGLKLDDMKLIEINEAFAAQILSVEKELGYRREIANVDGGAIAIGHPLGASGARITAHLLHRLRAGQGGYGLGSACIGGGQGIAVVVKV